MQRTTDAVNNCGVGWLPASKQYGVLQATLRRRAQNNNKIFNGIQKGLRFF